MQLNCRLIAESIDIKIQNKNDAGNSVWTGYKNFSDITNMSVSDLAPGSRNTFIQDGDRLQPRAGIAYFGAQGTQGNTTNPYWCIAHRIHSKYDNFVNVQGVKMPFRVYYSGTTAKGDVIETWLPIYSGGIATSNKKWYQITANAPTNVALSTHRYYWAEWWDPLNLLSHVVFTMGDTEIWNYNGAFANVTAVTGTTIKTNTTWREKGFIKGSEGNNIVIIKGVEYQLTSGDFSTDTITVASTAGIAVDDIAFQSPDSNSTITGTTYDVCAMVNNQVYYIDWNQRNVYISWDKNQNAYLGRQINTSISGLNDGVFNGTYTGAPLVEGNGTFNVTIDSVTPATNEQTFIGNGGGSNSGSFDTAAYSASGEHKYIISIVSDVEITPVGASVTGTFTHGQVFKGTVSGSMVQLVAFTGGSVTGGAHFKLLTPGIYPVDADTMEDVTAPSTNHFDVLDGPLLYNTGILYKDGVQQILGGMFDGVLQFSLSGSYTLMDGLNFVIATAGVGGNKPGDYYELSIQTEQPDTFSWSFNGQNRGSNIDITGSPQTLDYGISIEFGATTGHAVGDSWTIVAYAAIERGWTQFFFSSPDRLPGQGSRQLLDSNGWSMKPQEKTMYVNADAGHYYTMDRVLSADQLTEVIKTERLKSEPQNKVLYPYLLNYEKNQIAGISQDRTYDSLGRQELVELPQTKSISDAIRIDFESADWEDGDFLYAMRKMFFVAPRDGNMFVWDDYKKYWHSPMTFAKRIGLISVIDGKLVGHSYEQNESYELFVGTSDLDIYPISTKMVFPYDSFGKRFFEKASLAIGFEGYIQGAPEIFYTMNADVGGCNGQATGQILPVVCHPKDKAPLGKSYLGYHGLGNDPVEAIPHFFFIDTFTKLNYYQRNMELTCDSLDQRWSIISIGTDVDTSSQNNTTIVHRKQV